MIGGISKHFSEVFNEVRYLTGHHYADFVTARDPIWSDDAVHVFTYHGVEPGLFAEQMAYLAANGYSTYNIDDFLQFLTLGRKPDKKGVLLTFDDGVETVWTKGAPILEKYAFQAVAFIVPTWVGTRGFLDWSQIADMHRSGLFDIQSHTMTHRPEVCGQGIDMVEIERELTRSKYAIAERLPNHTVEHLCYPQGAGSDTAVSISKKVGYKTNFWSGRLDRSLNRAGDDPYYVVRLKHDYIFRLPGEGRRSWLPILSQKVTRRLKGAPYA